MTLLAPDTALILEGGGMRGSYTAGVLDVLLERGVRLGWVGGISSGASNSLGFLDRDRAFLRYNFVEAPRQPEFGGVRWFMRGKGFFHSDYIYAVDPADQRELPRTPFRIGAVDAHSGEQVYWGNADVTDREGLYRRARASSSLPFFMPPTIIDGRLYFDGALGEAGGIPLDAAQQDGFEKFLVILSHPAGFHRPEVRFPRAMRTALWRYPTAAEHVLRRPERYNKTMAKLRELEQEGRAYLFAPSGYLVQSRELSPAKLARCFNSGRAQALAEWPRIAQFLGADSDQLADPVEAPVR